MVTHILTSKSSTSSATPPCYRFLITASSRNVLTFIPIFASLDRSFHSIAIYITDKCCYPNRESREMAIMNTLFLASLGDECLEFCQTSDRKIESIKPDKVVQHSTECKARQTRRKAPKSSNQRYQRQQRTQRVAKEGSHESSRSSDNNDRNRNHNRSRSDEISTCRFCRQPGHWNNVCFKLMWKNERKEKNNDTISRLIDYLSLYFICSSLSH